jgi:stress responsive alpha/beta barrel protein
MIRHVVLLKWLPGTPDEQIAEMAAGFDTLGTIATVRTVRHGPDLAVGNARYDYAIVADFDDMDGYLVYNKDEGHADLRRRMGPLIEANATVDYEF